ncbi:hypothetical protein [Nostoc sp. UHCC 0251]|uniref:hypothetical protein n=1 Tax=Nostoc sp. UHCC 0251 TaxID=3110240 RepID=UPI002B1F9412|nr:hypothetical protein [Nostoc sp. UHCC 0251]MEA5627717.1 hypothetical protein [Nostoc sp. UHCC 0251]
MLGLSEKYWLRLYIQIHTLIQQRQKARGILLSALCRYNKIIQTYRFYSTRIT